MLGKLRKMLKIALTTSAFDGRAEVEEATTFAGAVEEEATVYNVAEF
jgi:predicted SPOUT superfamily RNA methylase MTH1